MYRKSWLPAMVALMCVGVATLAGAAEQQKSYQPKSNSYGQSKEYHNPMKTTSRKEMVTFAIRGADSNECARMLSNTLRAHGIQASVGQSQNKPSLVEVSINSNEDLGALGKAIQETKTPDMSKQPPSLDLVLYGHFDSVRAKKATDALETIKGVDARNSLANEASGTLHIRIVGGDTVTADQIHRDLQRAGVWTQFSQGKTARTGFLPFRHERRE